MGALNRLVHLLSILDPNNVAWKHRQLEAAERDLDRAKAMEETEAREAAIVSVNARIDDIHKSFDTQHHDLDYARKLYLIENSIFGVDIQPIACQIAKLRFFISLSSIRSRRDIFDRCQISKLALWQRILSSPSSREQISSYTLSLNRSKRYVRSYSRFVTPTLMHGHLKQNSKLKKWMPAFVAS